MDGKDPVAAIMVETERRRQVMSDATANHIDVDAFVRATEADEAGAWFPAVVAALERFRTCRGGGSRAPTWM